MKDDVPEAGAQGNRFDIAENFVLIVSRFQIVIGDLGAQMVDMVETNVAAKPLQQFGQLEIGGTFESGPFVIPFVVPAPVGIFKLVLHIKEKYTYYGTRDGDRQPDHEDFFEAQPISQAQKDSQQANVGVVHRDAFFALTGGQFEGQAMKDSKKQCGGKNEHNDGVTIEAINEFAPNAALAIFFYRNGIDIAKAAKIEVT